MTTTRTLLRFAALALAVTAVCASASAGIRSKRLLTKIAEQTPAAVVVAPGSEMKSAEAHAAGIGATVLWGIGSSMEPIYAPQTAVVVKEVAYNQIKKGMTVVYRKANGHYVAHSVIGEDARGYIVQGVNNDEPDDVSVNEKNLVGVIAAAYSATSGGLHAMLAQANNVNGRTVAMR